MFVFPSKLQPIPLVIRTIVPLPMVGQMVHVGCPSPADDFIEEIVDFK